MKFSPLDQRHRDLGAKMAEFGGWEMPIAYPTGTLHEHEQCREKAAMFDVSHLGTLRVSGDGAFAALQKSFTNDLGRIGPGKAQYTHLLDAADASVLDDIIVWWHPEGPDGHVFDVMPNASNTDRVVDALTGDPQAAAVSVEDTTLGRAVIAVQGPLAKSLGSEVVPALGELGRFAVRHVEFDGVACVAAGTGYTGEDGFELSVPAGDASRVWDALVAVGVTPAGLGARDTLRLEAGLPLHGHELGPGITPWQAKLGWVVRLDKGDFRGRDALVAERDAGVARFLAGLRLEGRQPAREGAAVHHHDGRKIGVVTSGNYSPTLGCAIAFAFVAATEAEVGDSVTCEVRGKHLAAVVVKPPFVAKR